MNVGRCDVQVAAADDVRRRFEGNATAELYIVQPRRHVDDLPVRQRAVHRATVGDLTTDDIWRCFWKTLDARRPPPSAGIEHPTLDLDRVRLRDAAIAARSIPATAF